MKRRREFSEPAGRWLPVVGYEGLYEVSDHGQVRSLDRTDRGGKRRPGRVLRQSAKKPEGYLKVTLSRVPEKRDYFVHRLVIEAFTGPRPEGYVIRHLDGDPVNNRMGNLAYGTQSENILDAVRHGTHPESSRTHCPQGHPYDGDNLAIRRGKRECRECDRARCRKRYRLGRIPSGDGNGSCS